VEVEHDHRTSPGPAGRWTLWLVCLCVLGLAVCAVLSSIEIDRLGY